jgi:NAD(P)-dependent dehydrogenase (short-subunit alcohol dehydrogenase family)
VPQASRAEKVSELRFDGRVAVVTGAGRGLGAAYARLLASRGAQVVVNDLGSSMAGDGADAGPASTVVDEIVAAGGVAAADTNDVGSAAGADALIATALERFGRIDAVVNNAGIMRWGGLPELDEGDMARHWQVHVAAAFHTTRAVWPHLVEQGSGRLVLTTSSGVFGLPANTAYATAKGGVIGLMRSLATAGAPLGIRVNAIAPGAFTRMAGKGEPPAAMAPELVAPMAAYLAHEDCPVTGEIYAAGFGRFARVFVAQTEGYVASRPPTVEDVAAHWDAINDERSYTVPADLTEWSATFMAHLDPPS